jgi:hypothetical protein
VIYFLIPACSSRPAAVAKPAIKAVIPGNAQGGRYEPFEWVVDLQAAYANPCDARQVALEASFKAPDGQEWFVPGYWDADKFLGIICEKINESSR